MSADRAAALRRITVASSVADAVKDCRLVIEAVVDDLTTKSGVYADAVRNCRSDAVLATTSMNFPLSQIQVRTDSEAPPENIVTVVICMAPWHPRLLLCTGIAAGELAASTRRLAFPGASSGYCTCRGDSPYELPEWRSEGSVRYVLRDAEDTDSRVR